ncbi:hypothetical protein ColLi_09599 [Colletotrichum liriopes]|uniref:Uncharacterized protein n=1 Tax=Colletotrichum liriopes TaxID=708192 RepID=A0AA37GU12_9PEZI|nr:hypothetical protein ColLi_09599 [Colletotrichum liriopes]
MVPHALFNLHLVHSSLLWVHLRNPLTAKPAVEEVGRGLGLVHGDHVAGAVELHKGEVAAGLDLAVLVTLADGQTLDLGLVEALLAGPLESLGPGTVAEPVADVVGVTSVDENGNLLKKLGDDAVERLEPIACEEEVAVDVEVAAVVAVDLGTEGILDLILVEVLADPAKSRVAEVAAVLALAADVVDVLAGALVGADEGVVAVDAGGNARPDTAGVVAVLDQALAAGESVVHGLAFALVEDSGVATLAASHGTVVAVLGPAVGQTVTDQDALQVDVAVLVGENLRGENGNVVAGVRLAGNVEVLLGVLGELVEEEGEQGVDVLAGGDRVGDGGAGVGVADVDGLVKEDDRGIVVPRPFVVDDLELLVTAVLLDLVDAEGRRVDLLGAQVEVLEVTSNLAVLLAVLLNPHLLDVGALDDVVPLLVGLAVGGLGLGGMAFFLKASTASGASRVISSQTALASVVIFPNFSSKVESQFWPATLMESKGLSLPPRTCWSSATAVEAAPRTRAEVENLMMGN